MLVDSLDYPSLTEIPTPAYYREQGSKTMEVIALYESNWARLSHERCSFGASCSYEHGKCIQDTRGVTILPFTLRNLEVISQSEFDATMAAALNQFEKQCSTGGRYES